MFQILLISLIYLILLIIISPIIDHLFTGLHKDESEFEILSEITGQLIVVILIWYYLNAIIQSFLKTYLKFKINEPELIAIDIVSAIVLIGLQHNLMIKLNYITKKHPIRSFIFQLFNN